MSAAIRAQRERHAVPKTIAPDPSEPENADEPARIERPRSLSERLRGK